MASAQTAKRDRYEQGIGLQRLNKRLTGASSASMRLCCQCQRPPAGRLEAIRTARLIAASVAAAVLGALALAVAAPASAATPCWKSVLNEWTANQNGYISSNYPLHCYGDAIRHVPEDLAQYTGVIEDIQAARQRAARGIRTVQSHKPSSNEAAPNDPSGGVYNSAIDKLGPTNSDSLPLPLLILAGLALVMVAAGGAGLLSRRLKGRKTAA